MIMKGCHKLLSYTTTWDHSMTGAVAFHHGAWIRTKLSDKFVDHNENDNANDNENKFIVKIVQIIALQNAVHDKFSVGCVTPDPLRPWHGLFIWYHNGTALEKGISWCQLGHQYSSIKCANQQRSILSHQYRIRFRTGIWDHCSVFAFCE